MYLLDKLLLGNSPVCLAQVHGLQALSFLQVTPFGIITFCARHLPCKPAVRQRATAQVVCDSRILTAAARQSEEDAYVLSHDSLGIGQAPVEKPKRMLIARPSAPADTLRFEHDTIEPK